mgnify:FL=1
MDLRGFLHGTGGHFKKISRRGLELYKPINVRCHLYFVLIL